MESGKSVPAIDFHHKSADFQLATLFKAPGYRNEYLGRICISLIAKISKAKKFGPEDDAQMNDLMTALPALQDSDPVRDLIVAIQEMKQEYGRN